MISEKIIAERMDAIPKAEDLIKALDPTRIPLDVYRTIVADVAYQIADMREKARKVELGEVTSKLEEVFYLPNVVSICFVKSDGTPGDKLDGMRIVQYVNSHGMDKEGCNLKRWFEISGVIEESDPTKSATAY
jgi:hypothetical protein